MESMSNFSDYSAFLENSTFPALTQVLHHAMNSNVTKGGSGSLLLTKTAVIIKCCIVMLIVLIGIPGNGFMVYVIWKTQQLRNGTNILLAWFTISDMISCVFTSLFVAIYQLIAFVVFSKPCLFVYIYGYSYIWIKTGPGSGAAMMLAIAIDRYTAIAHPFLYNTLDTNKWAKASVMISWAYGFALSIACTAYLPYVDFSSCATPYSIVMQCVIDFGSYIVISPAIAVLYGRVFMIAIQQRSKVDILPNARTDKQSAGGRFRAEMKAVKTTALIVGSFVIFWFPYALGRLLQGIGNINEYTQTLIDIGFSLGFFNESFNWLIYGATNKPFRMAMMKVFHLGKDRTNS